MLSLAVIRDQPARPPQDAQTQDAQSTSTLTDEGHAPSSSPRRIGRDGSSNNNIMAFAQAASRGGEEGGADSGGGAGF